MEGGWDIAACFSSDPGNGGSTDAEFKSSLSILLKETDFRHDVKVPTILRTKTDNSFFGSSRFGNKLSTTFIDFKEFEVLRLGGAIKCDRLVPEPFVEAFIDT